MTLWCALVGLAWAGSDELPVAWDPAQPADKGVVGQADWAQVQLDADPRPDAVALVTTDQGVVAIEIVANGGETVRRVNLAEAAPEARLAVADADGDGLTDLALGLPLADKGLGQVNVFFDLANLPEAADWATSATVHQVPGVAQSGFGAALAWIDGDGDGDLDLAIGRPGPNAGGVQVHDVVGQPEGADPLWSAEVQGDAVYRFGVGLAVRPEAGDLLVLGCLDGVDDLEVCSVRAAWTFASDGTEAALGLVTTTRHEATILGEAVTAIVTPVVLDDGSLWLTGSSRTVAVAGSGTPDEVAVSSSPVGHGGLASLTWQGAAHTAWVQDGLLSLRAGDPADGDPVAAAVADWPELVAARVAPAGDWDGDGCADVWVGTSDSPRLLAGDCTVPGDTASGDTAPPLDTDTGVAPDDTDAAEICVPSFGWSCATMGPAPWWLAAWAGVLLAGRRRR